MTIRHKVLSLGNTLCAAQNSARPKSSFPFYEKLYTYVSPRVSALKPCLLLLSILAAKMSLAYVILDLVFSEYAMKGIFQYSVKRTLVVLKIDDDNETKNVQVRAQRPYLEYI